MLSTDYCKTSCKEGIQTLWKAGLTKVAENITDLTELRRVVQEDSYV
ncbi:hypothetical protein [Candidatus Coxiella mudrowiae]|nr:hypothetical protein [Candidatus Coxiella mudrowiae]